MSRTLLPKYMCRDLAKACNEELRPRPRLLWQQVADYLEPPMIPRENYTLNNYDPLMQRLISRWLQREFQRLHLWRHRGETSEPLCQLQW